MLRYRRAFAPPHCPNPDCDSHGASRPWRYKRKGFYTRQRGPRRVQRYACQHCRRSFSSQTFSTTYWLRRPDLQRPLFWRLLACSALRQIARELGVAPSTLQRQAERLGRHCLLLHEALRPERPHELLVLDGFRSFELGQYWPFDINLLVGASHYVYGFNDAELRRSGTHTPGQRAKRQRLEARHGCPDPRATEHAVGELVARVVPVGAAVEIVSDDHRSYPRALRRLADRRILHRTVSSRVLRTPVNPLFPANLADLLLRHSGANHKRETIAFSKRRQGALYRAAVWLVWRNYIKSRSERRRDEPPAVAIGVTHRAWSAKEVLRSRLFPWREPRLEGWLARCYRARIPTRRLTVCREHRLKYAV
jgi:transposase-like protein